VRINTQRTYLVCPWKASAGNSSGSNPDYYRRGGETEIFLSHAVCKACFDRNVAPVFRVRTLGGEAERPGENGWQTALRSSPEER
jgi:hypothetical protein